MKALLLALCFGLVGCGPARPTPEQLVQGLEGPDAVNCFAELRQREDAIQAVIAGTHHPNPRIRGQCARLLGTLREVEAVEALRPLLRDPHREVRSQAARALVPLVETSELVRWLRSGELNRDQELSLVRALLRDPTEFMEPDFVLWLRQTRRDVAWRLELYQALLEFHSAGFGRARRERTLLAEVRAGRRQVAAGIRPDALDRGVPEKLRLLAIPLYALLGGEETWLDVRRLAEQFPRGSSLRLRALQAVGMSRNPAAVAFLSACLGEQGVQPQEQAACLAGLGHLIHRPGALDTVLPFLENPTTELRYLAIEVLAGSRDARAEAALRRRFDLEMDPRLRRRISASLRAVRNQRGESQGKEGPAGSREQPPS